MFEVFVVVAALLCGLVAGLLFAFAIVAMPGIEPLDDRAFLRAFQGMDRIIQNNHPLFVLVWGGSVVALLAAAVIGFVQSVGSEVWLVVAAGVVYLIGVQLPTVAVNVPLNTRLQGVMIDEVSDADAARERQAFESRWNRWNRIRALLAVIATTLLLLSLARL